MTGDFNDRQRQFYDTLLESQWWSATQLRDHQRHRLAQLLRHARRSVPFYARRLDPVLKWNGEIDWDRWAELPILKRRDLADHHEAMQADSLPDGHGPTAVFETSGSTSLPIKVTTNGAVTIAGNASRWRGQRWNTIDWTRNLAIRLGNSTAPLESPFGELLGHWAPPWLPTKGQVWELNVRLPAERVLEFLVAHDCAYLNTGAAPAHVFALEAQRLGIAPPRLDAILAQGASVGPADREICRRVFGARIVETYSSKEGGVVANPCEQGRMHVNAESCLVEIVDAEGNLVADGTSGRVIVTPFFNTAQPLIRYDQGDIAALSPETCPCGRHSLVLSAIEGRSSIFFTHPDGRHATSLMPDSGRVALDCNLWQIAQVGPLLFEVRYVPNNWNVTGDETEFIRMFRAQYFDDAEVRLKRVKEIPLSASGKFVEYKLETT